MKKFIISAIITAACVLNTSNAFAAETAAPAKVETPKTEVVKTEPSKQEPVKDIVKTPVSAFNKENLRLIKSNDITNDFLRIITFSQNTSTANPINTEKADYSKNYADANEKFAQGNITAAYKDYKNIFADSTDDFINLGIAYKFANMGLFSLAQDAINNIQDREIYNYQIQQIKSKLFPQVVLSYDDEIMLAQYYTEIYYNNLAFEVARDLNKMPDRLKRSDYAHFILAQAYYNIKEYGKANNEINRALSINPDNVNYLKYKAQIYCETNRMNDAVKTVDEMLEQDVNILDFRNGLEGLKYYSLAKATKDREKSKYFLAKYFIKTGDFDRASKELSQNISKNKKDVQSMTLLAEIYFRQNKLADAMDLYEKAYKIKKNSSDTLMGIANMYMYKKDYKNALDFYLKAAKRDKSSNEALINASLCYKNLGQNDKAAEFANKALAKQNAGAVVYYTASKIDEIKNIQYLKKTVSIDPMFTEAWLDLTDIAIRNGRTDLAKNYLKPVKYTKANNSRYYYYSGLINKQQGNKDAAVNDFKKSLELNPFFDDATKELNNVQL